MATKKQPIYVTNGNFPVMVELTEKGWDLLSKHFAKYHKAADVVEMVNYYKSETKDIVIDGVVRHVNEFQLFDVISKFGDMGGLADDSPFKYCQVFIGGEYIRKNRTHLRKIDKMSM